MTAIDLQAVFHCTTERKLLRYLATGCILPPVRFWRSERRAREWSAEKMRPVILRFPLPTASHPLPDHWPPLCAWWTPDPVRAWDILVGGAP